MMASEQSVAMAKALATARYFSFSDVDTHILMRVQYIGAEASGTVEISAAGDWTFKHGDLSSEAVDGTIDSGGDDPGVIDISDANANTLGEIAGHINGSPNWRCFLECGLFADSAGSDTFLVRTATAAKVAAGVSIFADNAGDIGGAAITGFQFKNTGSNLGKVTDGMQTEENCINVLFAFDINIGATGNGTVKIYDATQLAETEIYSATLTDDTDVSLGTTDLDAPVAKSSMGSRLVVRTTATTTYDDISKYIVIGEVRDYTGDRTP